MRNNHSRLGIMTGEVRHLGRVAATNATKAVATLRKKGRRALAAANRARAQVRTYVIKNPVQSLLIAMGVGAVVGFLLRRRPASE